MLSMMRTKRLASAAAVLGLAGVGVAAVPHEANAWWRGGYGVGIWVPPVIVAPPPVYYAPPPVYYAPPAVAYVGPQPAYYPQPRRFWVPPHWEGPYWVHGHWS
jgi:hypothetical protein